ncbi:hypothetical protein AN221_32240 [Streptomyces nanshensis]|uniref:Uncharacterized protein n=1 Tax=Streptomyces nanshensis TaxID=518642 RepID=A0A1E7LJE7_9ACTN|nr:hypothetical protein AN221_32240 [Streptomyces nanshensis]
MALSAGLSRIRDQLAVIASLRPTPEQLANDHSADVATARRIHQARPGVPVHHVLAVLEVLRAMGEMDDSVPVPLKAFDRLVRVAMWVSRGQAMAHVPDPQISDSYPDAAARFALGALDDAGLLNAYREKASGRPTHQDGTPYRYHEIVAEGWGHCDGCRTWGQGWTAENPHECPGTYVKEPSTEEAPHEP